MLFVVQCGKKNWYHPCFYPKVHWHTVVCRHIFMTLFMSHPQMMKCDNHLFLVRVCLRSATDILQWSLWQQVTHKHLFWNSRQCTIVLLRQAMSWCIDCSNAASRFWCWVHARMKSIGWWSMPEDEDTIKGLGENVRVIEDDWDVTGPKKLK